MRRQVEASRRGRGKKGQNWKDGKTGGGGNKGLALFCYFSVCFPFF